MNKPNYINEVLKQSHELKPGLYVVGVAHDDWCKIFNGGECNCNPIVEKPKTVE